MKKLKVCVDAGHGMGNRHEGIYDPGACHKAAPGSPAVEEAQVAYLYAIDVAAELNRRGVDTFLTRPDPRTAAPVWLRDDMAHKNECDVLVSIHLNDAESKTANGIEVLWRRDVSEELADRMQQNLVRFTGFRDRGIKRRADLAVLAFKGPAILIELGFINHDLDRAALLGDANRKGIANVIASTIRDWWEEKHDGLPF